MSGAFLAISRLHIVNSLPSSLRERCCLLDSEAARLREATERFPGGNERDRTGLNLVSALSRRSNSVKGSGWGSSCRVLARKRGVTVPLLE